MEATTRCFLELIKEVFTKEELDVTPEYFRSFREKKNLDEIQLIGLKHINLKQASDEIRARLKKIEQEEVQTTISEEVKSDLKDAAFAHLHNHTQFSVLQSTIAINDLVKASAKFKMPAVAMTDTGNMMGAFHFVSAVLNHNKAAETKNKELVENGEIPTETVIKPIVGCEFNICDDHKDKTKKDNGYQVVLLAKIKRLSQFSQNVFDCLYRWFLLRSAY